MQKNNQGNDSQKGSSGGFFLVIVAAILALISFQSLNRVEGASISFRHQLEHAVNLALLRPEENKMSSTGADGVVTFSGKFATELSTDSQASYAFLAELNSKNLLLPEIQSLEENLPKLKKDALLSSELFLMLVGNIPKAGVEVINPLFDKEGKKNSITVTPDNVDNYRKENNLQNVKSLSLLKGVAASIEKGEKGADEATVSLSQDLNSLLQWFRSERVAMNLEYQKRLAQIQDRVVAWRESGAGTEAALTAYKEALANISDIVKELQTEQDAAKLTGLTTVSRYKTSLHSYSDLTSRLAASEEQLKKLRRALPRTTWYFNGQELTTGALEKQNPEVYTAWFTGAKAEWDGFAVNQGKPFKAPDQARSPVPTIEKNFKSEESARAFSGFSPYFMMVVFFMMLLYFIFSRQVKGGAQGAMSFGNNPAKLLNRDTQHATFKDVAGCDESKEELQEIVHFLKDPECYTRLGARIPKGVLLAGSPGTGKTLLARAVAGEAEVPFFTISGSDFVEMFVGVGAKRIRTMFEQGRQNSPCIIFIDEIDAVGRQRGAGISGGHDEREQTLNQLLVEMDGFGPNDNVILIAATNRPDILDKALLRPGRFDRHVTVELPDVKGRYAILCVHAKKIKLDPGVDLMLIARSTPGCSGADLENILNESALLAASQGKTAVTQSDVSYARDKVLYGKERRSFEMGKKELLATAYHESGHAIVALNVENSDTVSKVTIIPRGMSLGATHFAPKQNRVGYSKDEVIDQLAILMGGRAAEELFLKTQLSGCQQDIDQATKLARAMICQWGMSEELGLVAYDERNSSGQYLGGASTQEKAYSETTAQKIDAKIQELVGAAHLRAKEILQKNSAVVEKMTEMLMKFETLEASDVTDLCKGEFNEQAKEQALHIEAEKKHKQPPPVPKKASDIPLAT